MKRTFIASASIAALAGIAAFGATSFMPVQATTFPSLRPIYVAAGVADWNLPAVGTAVPCTNLSGQNATIRWSFFTGLGNEIGSRTFTVPHGRTEIVSTESGTAMFGQTPIFSAHDFQGRVIVASTQSAVFCSAILAHPTSQEPLDLELHMVRFNPHPGTVE